MHRLIKVPERLTVGFPQLVFVVGVLIEVPVMLSLVKIVNGSRGWYDAGVAVRERQAEIAVDH